MPLFVWPSIVGAMAWATNAHAQNSANISAAVTPVGNQVNNLHLVILWICAITAAIVFAAMIYSIFSHRKTKNSSTANFHKNFSIEFMWTVIPFAILVLMAIPAAKTLLYPNNTQLPEVGIKVTGNACKWIYDYLDYDVSLSGKSVQARREEPAISDGQEFQNVDNPVVVPILQKIHFMFSAIDRSYTWSVPDLGVEQAAAPGVVNDRWIEVKEPGVYRGLPVDACGPDGEFMPIVVIATTELEYRKWRTRQIAVSVPDRLTP